MAIIVFLLVNGLFLFVFKDSSIFEFGYASLDRFFELAPWVLLFLVPAITMRSLSDEFRTGTFEILKTSPPEYRAEKTPVESLDRSEPVRRVIRQIENSCGDAIMFDSIMGGHKNDAILAINAEF